MTRRKITIIKANEELEVEAKTSHEAIKIALQELNAKKSEVDIKVLREENLGLFSMQGSKLAKINVKKKLQ